MCGKKRFGGEDVRDDVDKREGGAEKYDGVLGEGGGQSISSGARADKSSYDISTVWAVFRQSACVRHCVSGYASVTHEVHNLLRSSKMSRIMDTIIN